MRKKYLSLLLAIFCIAGKSKAQVQPCYTDEIRKRQIAEHPEILMYEAKLEKQISDGLKHIDFSKVGRTTGVDELGNPDFWYDIPIVVHVIHDFGAENVTDDQIFDDLILWNQVYAEQNSADTAAVISPFKKWIGNPHIRLHLATKDPSGNPTHGITRHRSYLTYTGGEQSKFDVWPPSSYVNIWSVNRMSSGNTQAAAYAFPPSSAASNPWGDGIITLYDYLHNDIPGGSKTINHEMGHVFNLAHTWGGTNNPEVSVGDDNVDDTPPTKGHNPGGCTATALFDTVGATNYYRIYTSILTGLDSLVDYPDTANSQNIMDYTYCSKMFTKGQVYRMHAALNSDVAYRDSLWAPFNLMITGALSPLPDLKPIPEFAATQTSGSTDYLNYISRPNYFVFPGVDVKFVNETWNDTVTNLLWTFDRGASKPTDTSRVSVTNKFTDGGGWVKVTMQATGNHTGDSTRVWDNAIFVAANNATLGKDYYQEFTSGGDVANWPIFNYYNNNFKWQVNNSVGLYDHSSIQYVGYDDRAFPTSYSGMPAGDFDDFFSIPFDLTSGDAKYLNFVYSGASRSSRGVDLNDSLIIDYSTKTKGWTNLARLTKSTLANMGSVSTAYTPSYMSDWAPMAITLPTAAQSPYTVFRFRYKPSVAVGFDGTLSSGTQSSGNNFYLDRIHFGPYPESVTDLSNGGMEIAIVPNPTTGSAYVVIRDVANTSARVVVSDITGKMVYSVEKQVSGAETHIEIPQSAISVPGLYLVQTITGSQVTTKKLIVQ